MASSDDRQWDTDYWSDHFTLHAEDLAERWTRGTETLLDQMLEQCPVFRSKEHGGFVGFTEYEAINEINKDDSTYSHHPNSIIDAPDQPPIIPQQLDGEIHRKYRSVLRPFFSEERVTEEYESELRKYINGRIDAIQENEEFDFAREVAIPVPFYVISEIFGIPADDRKTVKDWTDSFVRFVSLDEEPPEEIREDVQNLKEYLRGKIRRSRDDPGEDLLGHMTQADIDGETITDEELIRLCLGLIPAGFETTHGIIEWSMLFMSDRPDIIERLRDHPELIPGAVEEFFRLCTSVIALGRRVTEDVERDDQKLEAGDKVAVLFAAANRDPEIFDDPGTFDPERDPNPHMTFGSGPHYCLGAPLARLEMNCFLEEWLSRVSDWELSGEPEISPGPVWNMTRLPMKIEFG